MNPKPVETDAPLLEITERNGQPCEVAEGAAQGQVVGTLVHGLFASREVRASLLGFLRRRGCVPFQAAIGGWRLWCISREFAVSEDEDDYRT